MESTKGEHGYVEKLLTKNDHLDSLKISQYIFGHNLL